MKIKAIKPTVIGDWLRVDGLDVVDETVSHLLIKFNEICKVAEEDTYKLEDCKQTLKLCSVTFNNGEYSILICPFDKMMSILTARSHTPLTESK